MNRVLAQYLSLATATLGVFECVLSFFLILAALSVLGTFSLGGDGQQSAVLAVSLALTIAISVGVVGLYRPEFCLDRQRLLLKISVAAGAAIVLAALIIALFNVGPPHVAVLWLLATLPICFGGILLTRLSFAALVRDKGLARRVLVLGSDARAARIVEVLRRRYQSRFEPVTLPPGTKFPGSELLRQQRIWGVVIAAEASDGRFADVLLDSKLRGVRVCRDTGFVERHLGRIDLETVSTDWLIDADGFASGRITDTVKRFCDILISLALLFLTLPVMALTALLIRLDSPGPVLYRQERSGLHGKPFTLLKFRSMRTNAEDGGEPRWAQLGDPRVTRIGSFIRPMRIDELPQLFNVLRGEMSMIGPRPERPLFVEQLTHVIPFYHGRAYVKPGLTGWAQVNYPYGASVEDAREKLAYDLYYVKNRSLTLDFLILASTIRVVLFREGAR